MQSFRTSASAFAIGITSIASPAAAITHVTELTKTDLALQDDARSPLSLVQQVMGPNAANIFEDLGFSAGFADQYPAELEESLQRFLDYKESLSRVFEIAHNPNGDGINYITLKPGFDGYHDMRFTHIAGSVGIVDKITKDGTKERYMMATTGIEVDATIMEQIGLDPRGRSQIGGFVDPTMPWIKQSENAAMKALLHDNGALREFQIRLGARMRKDMPIQIALLNPDGEPEYLDVSPYQDKEAADHLVFIARDNPEILEKIQKHMENGGDFAIAMGTGQNRQTLTLGAFEETYAENVEKAKAALGDPGFYFPQPLREFMRHIAVDQTAEAIDYKDGNCDSLMLKDENGNIPEGIKIVEALIVDGTSTDPRDWLAHVAYNAQDEIIAVGSKGWWGINLEKGEAVLSMAAKGGFTELGDKPVDGCTGTQSFALFAAPGASGPAPSVINTIIASPNFNAPLGFPLVFLTPRGSNPGGTTMPPIIIIQPKPIPLPLTLPLLISALLMLRDFKYRSNNKGASEPANNTAAPAPPMPMAA